MAAMMIAILIDPHVDDWSLVRTRRGRMPMQFWTFLHILSMFSAVTIVAGGALFVTWAVRRRDLDGLRVYFRIAPRMDMLGGILFVAGIVFGLIAAMVTGWDLFSTWLIFAYVLVVVVIGTGGAISPYLKRVKIALDANEGEEVGEDLGRLLNSPTAPLAAAVLIAAIALIIADMVYKPGL